MLQSLIFTYHKTGTTLFSRIMAELAERAGRTFRVQYGMAWHIDPAADIVQIAHGLLGIGLDRPFRRVRVIRDPRDIWVSSYLYHLRTNEGWCVNTNLDLTPPIGYPRVDFSMLHRPERWKRRWLTRLNGRSYQACLRDLPQIEGLLWELAGYTDVTLAAMRAWRPLPGVIDVRLEDISADFDGTMSRVFAHLAFSPAMQRQAMDVAIRHDLNRMDDVTLAANKHAYSRQVSKWRHLLPEELQRAFAARHGDLVQALGYPTT